MFKLQPNDTLNLKAFVFISFVCVLAFWQVATFQNVLKWDIIDGKFPNTYLEAEYLQEDVIPLWNPYSDYGMAVHSKMPNWYPVRYILTSFGKYSLYTLNIEFLLHLIFAGFGLYLLGRYLRFSFYASILIGCAYMMSGFFVGHGQHMAIITSGTWLPFLVLTYMQFVQRPNFCVSIVLSFVAYSFVSGGYPGISFVVFYLVAFALLYQMQKMVYNRKLRELWILLSWHLLVAFCFILLGSIVLVSYSDMVANVTRGAGLTVEVACKPALDWKNFSTFVFSYLNYYTQKRFWGIDTSMVSTYIGLFPFVLFLLVFKLINNKVVLSSLVVIFLLISISMGHHLPVREFLYDYVPLFNLFRSPAILRVLFLLPMLLLCGYVFTSFIERFSKETILRWMFYCLGLFLFVAIIFYFKSYDLPVYTTITEYKYLLHKSHLILFQSVTFVVLLSLGIVLIRYTNINWKIILVFITIIEMGCNVQFMIHRTIIGESPFEEAQKALDKLPNGFPHIESNQLTSHSHSYRLPSPFWRNTNFFYKKPGYHCYTSYCYNSMDSLYRSQQFETVKKLPFAYMSSSVDSSGAYVPDTTSSIKMLSFKTNRFEFEVMSVRSQKMVLLQNNYPGWKVYLNGEEQTIESANIAHMSLPVPAGKHTVVFEYLPRKVIIAYYLFKYSLYAMLLFFLYSFIRKRLTI